MKMTICGSIGFINKMKDIKEKLEKLGHEVLVPLSVEINQGKSYWNELKTSNFEKFLDLKGERMLGHFDKVKSSDAVLVLNYDRNGVENYIGGNTFVEMAIAFEHNKKIFILNPIPKNVNYDEEIKSMRPLVINGDLTKIR
jgi:hypothetical protein